jgi:hypothetical protein
MNPALVAELSERISTPNRNGVGKAPPNGWEG